MAKLADARDLKSRVPHGTCGFDSRPGHHRCSTLLFLSLPTQAFVLKTGEAELPKFWGNLK